MEFEGFGAGVNDGQRWGWVGGCCRERARGELGAAGTKCPTCLTWQCRSWRQWVGGGGGAGAGAGAGARRLLACGAPVLGNQDKSLSVRPRRFR